MNTMIHHGIDKRVILKVISSRHRHNPIKSSEIERSFNISGPTVRQMVRELRRYGDPIVAGEHGYYLARSPEEVNLIVTDLEKRIHSMGKTVSELKRRAYERFGSAQGRFNFGSIGGGIQKAIPGSANRLYKYSEEKSGRGNMLPLHVDRQEEPQGCFLGEGEGGSLDDLL